MDLRSKNRPWFTFLYIKDDAVDLLTWVGCTSIANNLRKQDPEGPDIRFNGKRAIVDGFRCRPFNREFGSFLIGRRFKIKSLLFPILILILMNKI